MASAEDDDVFFDAIEDFEYLEAELDQGIEGNEEVSTDFAKFIRKWAINHIQPVKLAPSEFNDTAKLRQKAPKSMTRVTIQPHPAEFQDMANPVKPGRQLYTSAKPVNPFFFHVNNTVVWAFNPFHWKKLWQCSEVSRCKVLLKLAQVCTTDPDEPSSTFAAAMPCLQERQADWPGLVPFIETCCIVHGPHELPDLHTAKMQQQELQGRRRCVCM